MKKFDTNSSITLLPKVFLGGFAILLISLFYYQIIKGDYYYQRAKNNYIRVVPLRAVRGSIFDRNGVVLSYDKAVFNISVIPYQISEIKDPLFKALSKAIDYDIDLIYKNYDKNKDFQNFFSPVDIMVDIEKADALKLKDEFGDAILINPQPRRFYTYPFEFAHLLGYVQKASSFYDKLKKYGFTPLERVGFGGIEQSYDSYLKGEDGGDLIEVDARGRVVGYLGQRISKKGEDIYLSVDSRIQEAAYRALGKRRGVIILMDSRSGEIIALCSSPSFDPNRFIEGKGVSQYFNDEDAPLFNRAIQRTYPTGSTFKPILATAALETGKIAPSRTFTCTGELKMGNAQFRCNSIHYEEDLYDALTHSCNVYFYNLGLLCGINTISKWAKDFGLDSPTGIDLPHEKIGFVPDPKWKQKEFKQSWFAGDTLNISIGQGYLTATPMEVTIAINAIANNGYLVRPYILKQVANTPSSAASKTYIGIKDNTLNIIKRGLRDVVAAPDGTARILHKLGLQIAGKTGTAQTKGESHGWFVGFFPYNAPKYTVCIFLENAGSSHEALKVLYEFLKEIKEKELI